MVNFYNVRNQSEVKPTKTCSETIKHREKKSPANPPPLCSVVKVHSEGRTLHDVLLILDIIFGCLPPGLPGHLALHHRKKGGRSFIRDRTIDRVIERLDLFVIFERIYLYRALHRRAGARQYLELCMHDDRGQARLAKLTHHRSVTLLCVGFMW